MAKWHLNPNGEAGVCRAENDRCPFGQHFAEAEAARKAFELAAEFITPEETKEEHEIWGYGMDDLIAVNEAVEGGYSLRIANSDEPYLDVFREPEKARGNSRELAEYMRTWTDSDWNKDEGIPPYGILEHTPVGSLVGVHQANTYSQNGELYIVDYGFGEIDPNREWPYVGSVENWRKEVDKASVLGIPEKTAEPIDPRSLSVEIFPAGQPNLSLERAVMEDFVRNSNGTRTRFLSVDQVKVASIHYNIEDDGKPHIHSIETREEYRNHGYMKKLLKELAKEHGVEKLYSSGSMTNDGFTFTRHLTEPRPGEKQTVKWDNYGEAGKGTFTFVTDWVNGWANH